MARLRYNNLVEYLAEDIDDTVTSFDIAAALSEGGVLIPTVVAPDVIAMAIDQETIWVTAYTSGSTTITCLRGQEDTLPASHVTSTPVYNVITKVDLEEAVALDTDLAAIAALTSAANQLPYATGAGTWAMTTLSTFIRTLLDDADAATARTTLGAQPLDTDLTAIAALTSAADRLPYSTGSGTWSLATFTAAARSLLDDASTAAMLDTLVAEPRLRAINAQTGTTYTLVLADAIKSVEVANAAAIALTVPPNSSVAFPIGTRIPIVQTDAGQITLTPGAGVTINARVGLKTAGQWAQVELVKRATDTWLAVGDLAA